MASQVESSPDELQNDIAGPNNSSPDDQEVSEDCVLCGRSESKCSCSMTLDVMETGNFNGGGKCFSICKQNEDVSIVSFSADKTVFHDDIPGGMTPLVRTLSPYEYMSSFKISEGSVYKSPIFIKNAETNTVPVISDSCQPDSKKSTNGLIPHEEVVFNAKPTEQLKTEQKQAVNGVKTTDVPTIKNETTADDLQETKYQPPCLPTSPRKTRTRSVESAICDIEEKRLRKGVKRTRTRSLGIHPEIPRKLQKFDVKPLKTDNNSSQVPSSKQQQQEHKQKEHRSRDKHEHRSEHHKSKSSHDKKRRCSIGIQARPSHDSGRHYVKLLEPRPSLLESGNLSYPPSDVSKWCCRGVDRPRKCSTTTKEICKKRMYSTDSKS